MSEQEITAAVESNSETGSEPKKDLAALWTKRLLLLCTLIWVWHLFADRFAPYSEHTRVRTYVTPIVPQVSGRISEVNVEFNQWVKAGDLLFKIDQTDYIIARDKAQASYEQAVQNIGASGDDIVSAEAKLTQAETNLAYAETESHRYQLLAGKGVISKSDEAKVAVKVEQARADVALAQANLSKAQTRLGEEGADNPRIRTAYANLRKASLDLARTEVRAPADGAVLNATFSKGQYANAGQPLMTFLDTRLVWLESYIRENSLGHIEPGDEVEIALDKAPGRVFKGRVESVTAGVNWNKNGQSASALPTISVQEGWLRDAQRFPVVITFADDSSKGYRLEGGQADVVIYAGDNFLLNGIGWLQIRLMSYLSYLN